MQAIEGRTINPALFYHRLNKGSPARWRLRQWIAALLIMQGPMTQQEIADECDRLGIVYSKGAIPHVLSLYPEFVHGEGNSPTWFLVGYE